jgi:hypothetical protein
MMTVEHPELKTEAVPVLIQNWAEPAKPPFVKSTTIQTFVIDPAATVINDRRAQISNYEPKRYRLAIIVIDAAISVSVDVPNTSPDVSTSSKAPQGGYLPPSTTAYEFCGPDAMWINSGAGVTRVTVIKEYC